jgi:DNA invertase Pin-like site-specific DNA recombinase
MDKEKTKYFIYVRKSTEGDGRQVLSIDGQLEDLRKIISRENLIVVDTITEKRSAATPFNRPGYSNMITRLKKGEAAGVIVWHIDRLARNHLEAGEFQYLLQIGVIKSVWTMNREYQSHDNALLFSLEASVATQYSRDLSEKVRRGLLQKCELGQPPIFAPLGYLNTKFAAHGTNAICEDPQRWHIIRKGFDLLLSRKYNTPQIADILRSEYGLCSRPSGTRGGIPLHKSVLYNIFTDPFYSGYFYYKGKLYKGRYKPMVTVGEYDQAQEILGRKFKGKPQKHTFAFTGLIRCGCCGCAITASAKTKHVKTTDEYKTYTFYHCTKRKGVCTDKHYTRVEELESMIEQELIKYHLKPEFRNWAIRIVKEHHQDEIDKQEILKNEIDQQKKKIIKELDALIDMRVSSHISEEKYLQKKAEKEALLIRVEERINHIKNNTHSWLEQFTEKLDFAVNALERFKTRDPNEQRQVCYTFGWNWTLKDNNLIIDKLEWFKAVEEYSKAVESFFGRLEPQKIFDKYGENTSLEILRPLVRRLSYDVRTKNSREDKKSRNTSP